MSESLLCIRFRGWVRGCFWKLLEELWINGKTFGNRKKKCGIFNNFYKFLIKSPPTDQCVFHVILKILKNAASRTYDYDFY